MRRFHAAWTLAGNRWHWIVRRGARLAGKKRIPALTLCGMEVRTVADACGPNSSSQPARAQRCDRCGRVEDARRRTGRWVR